MATWRLVRAAERAGRAALRLLLRARRLDPQPRAADAGQGGRRAARGRVLAARTRSSRPSMVYSPGDPFLTLLAAHVAAAGDADPGLGPRPVSADLGRGRGRLRDGGAARRRRGATTPTARATSSPARRRSPTGTSSSRAALVSPPPADRRRPDRVMRRTLQARRAADRPGGVRHLGRGRAARGPDDLARTGPPTPSALGVVPKVDARGARVG